MSERTRSILLPTLDAAGCNAKVRARDLLALLGRGEARGYMNLANDAGMLAGRSSSLFTIDAIRPVTRSPESFGRIAVLHALNDLYTQGAMPVGVCISYAFDEVALQEGIARRIMEGVAATLKEVGVSLCKAHTLRAHELSISVAAVGECANPLRKMEHGASYSIILTKPIGGAYCYNVATLLELPDLARYSEFVMAQSHHTILSSIRQFCVQASTDITGFGLVGHLCCIADQYSSEITLRGANVPVVRGSSELEGSVLPKCSAERNRHDFGEYVEGRLNVDGLRELLFFTGETSGGLACVVSSSESDAFLTRLVEAGFVDAAEIGTIVPYSRPVVYLR